MYLINEFIPVFSFKIEDQLLTYSIHPNIHYNKNEVEFVEDYLNLGDRNGWRWSIKYLKSIYGIKSTSDTLSKFLITITSNSKCEICNQDLKKIIRFRNETKSDSPSKSNKLSYETLLVDKQFNKVEFGYHYCNKCSVKIEKVDS